MSIEPAGMVPTAVRLRRLVAKDVTTSRWLLMAGLPIYVLNLAAMGGIPPFAALMALSISGVLAYGSMALEEVQRTGRLWASLPIRRRDLVVGRYLSAVLGAVVGLGVSFGVERVMALVRLATDRPAAWSLESSLTLHAVLLILLLLMGSVLLPLCFRLGTGHGALAFAGVAVATLLAITLGGQAVVSLLGIENPLLDPELYRGNADSETLRAALDWLDRYGLLLLLASGVASVALFVASGALSVRFLGRRDLAA